MHYDKISELGGPNSFTTDSASFVQRKCGVTARVEPAFTDDARANRCEHKTSIKDLRNPYIIHKTAVLGAYDTE
jgi:hypothetical protein